MSLILTVTQTFGARITLGSSASVEFGQGIAQTTNCTVGDFLTVTPNSGFSNGGSSGSFDLTSFTLSHIPSTCWNKNFLFQAYDSSGNLLAIDNAATSLSATYQGASTSGSGEITGASGEQTSDATSGGYYGAFTITIASPVAITTSVNRVVVQSSVAQQSDSDPVSNAGWTLIYQTHNPSRNGSGGMDYDAGYGLGAEDAAAHFSGTIHRVRYVMTLDLGAKRNYYADAAYDMFTSSQYSAATTASSTPTVRDLQIPSFLDSTTRFILQSNVSNLTIHSNYPGVTNGAGLNGRIEIWPFNYEAYTSGLSPQGNGATFDWDDHPYSQGDFGSFQIANTSNNQLVFSLNAMYSPTPDIGFGNDTSGSPDWTFDSTNGSLLRGTPGATWRLQIFVQ